MRSDSRASSELRDMLEFKLVIGVVMAGLDIGWLVRYDWKHVSLAFWQDLRISVASRRVPRRVPFAMRQEPKGEGSQKA